MAKLTVYATKFVWYGETDSLRYKKLPITENPRRVHTIIHRTRVNFNMHATLLANQRFL